MSEDIKTAVIAEKDMPVNEAEKNASPKSIKTSKADKRLEKLTALKEKYEKAFSVQAEATRKADSINAQIMKIEKEIHAEEKGLAFSDLARIIRAFPDGMTADDIINYFV